MELSRLSSDQIHEIWSLCSDAYLRHGRRLSFPKGTEPTKTYQWRYVTAIAKKFAEWDFDEPTAKRFLDIAINHSKQSGTIQKGMAIFLQSNILEICYNKLKAETTTDSKVIDSLVAIRKWLQQKAGSENLLSVLLDRRDSDSFCNLAIWFQASKISPLYLSLSKTCAQALARLNRDCPDERQLLPKQTKLYIIRDEFLQCDSMNLASVREIFVNDWREPCLLPS